MRTTRTHVTLEISPGAYLEIRRKLVRAGYAHVINEEGEIDMHGIALAEGKQRMALNADPDTAP